jgi:hypothetical protein
MSVDIIKRAVISDDGRYRYQLSRIWDPAVESLVFVMLNPSTADAELDDPTIRRCMGFARRDGFGGIHVTNLYALRATNPKDLWTAEDPVGPDNDAWLAEMFSEVAGNGRPIVAAWGANAKPERVAQVMRMQYSEGLVSFGVTKSGAPRHPLYLPGDAHFAPWRAR